MSLSGLIPAAAPEIAADCPAEVRWSTGCPGVNATIEGPNAVLEGTDGRPGSTPSAAPATRPDPFTAPTPSPADAVTPNGQQYFDDITIVGPVTIADLASFRPLTGTTQMEPNGWTVAGLPTNFWVTATTHTLTGPLLDRPATVQFTPVATRYNYGDGTPTVRTPLGGSWASSGMAEFSETGTSHIYRSTGTYTVTPQVDFTVQYSYDGGAWVPVDGILTATADPLTANVVRASTVLVADDCLEAPNGPGC
jgi:hypothetical protein